MTQKEKEEIFKMPFILIHRMIHCIGLDNKKPQNGVYTAYRNLIFNQPEPDWERLEYDGHAEREDTVDGDILYRLTDKGFRAVAKRSGLMIRYTKEYQ